MASTLIGAALDDLDTPALLIDLDRLEANIGRTQAFAAARGWQLRPHSAQAKTGASPDCTRPPTPLIRSRLLWKAARHTAIGRS